MTPDNLLHSTLDIVGELTVDELEQADLQHSRKRDRNIADARTILADQTRIRQTAGGQEIAGRLRSALDQIDRAIADQTQAQTDYNIAKQRLCTANQVVSGLESTLNREVTAFNRAKRTIVEADTTVTIQPRRNIGFIRRQPRVTVS